MTQSGNDITSDPEHPYYNPETGRLDSPAQRRGYTDAQRLADQRGQLTNPLPDRARSAPEVRVSPAGELAHRWGPDEPWQFQGGTHDGEVAEDSEVEGWTQLVAVENALTEDLFDLVGPVLGTALALVTVREQLDTLNEMVAEIDFNTGWGADIRERTTSDLRDMLGDVRKAADKVEGRLT